MIPDWARDLVADWPDPTPEQIAEAAVLLRQRQEATAA